MDKRYFAIAEGRVQGVGFRYFTQKSAEQLGLTGWVRNMNDGTVQLEAQGAEEKTAQLFAKIKKGNMFIRVDRLEIEERPLEKETHFVTRI